MLVGLLGAGHIARALASGWRRPELAPDARPGLLVFDPEADRAAALDDESDALVCGSVAELVAGSEFVVLAMRPPDVPGALEKVAPVLGGRPLVSLAAFVTLADLQAGLPPEAQVARVMPNVAAAVGRGVFLVAPGSLGQAASTSARDLFGLVGTVVDVAEDMFDVATAVSGCGPGFTALFVEALAAAGVAAGLPAALADELAMATVAGSGELIERGGDAAALRAAVATPGGMTAAGVEVLESGGLRALVSAAVQAAAQRAKKGR